MFLLGARESMASAILSDFPCPRYALGRAAPSCCARAGVAVESQIPLHLRRTLRSRSLPPSKMHGKLWRLAHSAKSKPPPNRFRPWTNKSCCSSSRRGCTRRAGTCRRRAKSRRSRSKDGSRTTRLATAVSSAKREAVSRYKCPARGVRLGASAPYPRPSGFHGRAWRAMLRVADPAPL